MMGFVGDIEKLALKNDNFRQVLYTSYNSQLVVMSLRPREEIGEELHKVDQFFRCEAGEGMVVIDSIPHELSDGVVVIVPAGAKHNVINTSLTSALKLYTIYSPPHHMDKVVHRTKEEALADKEEFNGRTTE